MGVVPSVVLITRVWLVWSVAIAIARIWLLGRVAVARLLGRIAIAITRLEALALVVVASSLSAHDGGGDKLSPEGRQHEERGRKIIQDGDEARGMAGLAIKELTSSSKFPPQQLQSSEPWPEPTFTREK